VTGRASCSPAFDPPLPLTVSDRQHVLIAQAGQDSVGLSIIRPEGRFGFDMLTWVEAPSRYIPSRPDNGT
jgi:hypothetical protein